MRTLTESVKSEIQKKFGIETNIVVGVDWAGGGEVLYSSHELEGATKSVVSISDLDMTRRIDGSGGTQTLTVTLSDTGGELSQILGNVDVHKKPAKVYLTFKGVPLDQSLVLIDGEINSEITWDEGARTLQFTILSRIEGRLFGFAAEDGLFRKVDERQRTAAWPFRFGVTCNRPTVPLNNGLKGFLREPQGVPDPTLDAQICQARQIECPEVNVAPTTTTDQGFETREATTITGEEGEETSGLGEVGHRSPQFFTGTTLGQHAGGEANPMRTSDVDEHGQSNNIDVGRADRRCEREKFEKLCQLLRDKANQEVYESDTLTVAGGEEFPQGREITIRVGDVRFVGVMSGETFTIRETIRQDVPDNPTCAQIGDPAIGFRNRRNEPDSLAECDQPSEEWETRIVGGAGDGFLALDDFESAKFLWLPAGTDVLLDESSTRVHIVSAIPGTVTQVAAYRTFGDTSILAEVPTDYYEVHTVDYGDLEVVELRLPRDLSAYPDENWSDEVFVSFDSDVGPNPTDVIKWIAENYTDLEVDADNFAAVKTKLENYPCNYYHAEKNDTLSTIAQIAREARCAILVTEGVLRLTYLPEEPTADRILTEADLVSGSFSYNHTRTEDLITASRITWSDTGAEVYQEDPIEKHFSVENNVDKYGTFESQETYRTITDEQQAIKTATFWSIRESNTWRRVQFSTFIEHIDLETFDCVELDISRFPNVKVVVESVTFNSQDNTVEVEAWTPVLSGTVEEYFWAWPALKPAAIPYPEARSNRPDPRIKVIPPADHPLFVAGDGEEPTTATVGDEFPSDLDDVFPDTECKVATDYEVVDVIEPQFERIDFQRQTDNGELADQMNAAEAQNANANDNDDKEVRSCGNKQFATSCLYEVKYQMGTPTMTTFYACSNDEDDLFCNRTPGHKGRICTISGRFWRCHTFASKAIADQFAASITAERFQKFQSCSYRVGQQDIISAASVTAVQNIDPTTGSCDGSNDPDIDEQTHAPSDTPV